MMMARQKFGEGDWFAVPLESGGYAVGLIARMKSLMFGFFFGPARGELPTLDDVAGLQPGDAVLAGRFGRLGLRDGRWPVLGRVEGWDRAEWSMPPLVRFAELSGKTYEVFYDDDDPGRRVRESVVDASAADQRHRDGVMGDGFVVSLLTRELRAD